MKKLFYGLGAVVAVATPIATVVSCGFNDNRFTLPSYTRDETSDIYNEKAFIDFVNQHKDEWIRVKEVIKITDTNIDRWIVTMKVPKTGFANITEYDAFKNDPKNIPDGNVSKEKQ